MKHAIAIVWLRNDLRLHDHEVFTKAIQKANHIIPVYCLDPRVFSKTSFGFHKTGWFKANFLLESIANLRQNLQKQGSNLIVRIGKPQAIIPALAQEVKATAVFYHKEVTSEETADELALEQALFHQKITTESYWGSTLYHFDDLPFPIKLLPDIFTEFRKETERSTRIRSTFSAVKLPAFTGVLAQISEGKIPTIEDFGIEKPSKIAPENHYWKGGEDAGFQQLNQYFWENKLLQNYKETRNGLLGFDYSSKFSAWLALGCLSPRYIYEQVSKYEHEQLKNDSTYWLIFELMWRDYFRFVARKFGDKLFRREGIRNMSASNTLPEKVEKKLLERWINGQTGLPFIDANMRELQQTGYMSNRGRQNVASFLVKDLQVNWQYGAAYFEQQLLDYDVCSNWGNWCYVAGVGNDPRENRYFNIARQAKMYDANALYMKHWLPERAHLPVNEIHQLNVNISLQSE